MPGTWTVTSNARLPIHTFMAPEDGWLVTAHIIELPSQLLVVGAQYTLPFAREVARHAAELNNRGAAAFDAPLFALASVAGKIGAACERVAQEEREKVGDDIPLNARRPDRRTKKWGIGHRWHAHRTSQPERRHHFACSVRACGSAPNRPPGVGQGARSCAIRRAARSDD